MIDLDAILCAANSATKMRFDSAQAVDVGGGYIECPHCSGSGEVDLHSDYCNFDGVAIGVQFYGIGQEQVNAEAFYRAANPDAVIELVTMLRQAEKDAARYRWLRECHWDESPLCVVVNPKAMVKLGADCPSESRLDDAIDEAMNA